jgi:predicted dehydrogenase
LKQPSDDTSHKNGGSNAHDVSGNGRRLPRGRINVGLIGLGYWGPNVLRVLSEMEDVAVTRICDLDHRRLDKFCRRHPYTIPTTDFRMILDDPRIDAVAVATPVESHFELANQSVEAGKHTFVEKPLAATVREADALIELAQRENVVLMSGLTFLYSAPVRAIKELLQRRELGDLYFISSSRVNLGPYRKDVSVICDLAPHDFSMLLYWMDEFPTSIRAIGKDAITTGIPDVAFISMGFRSGVVANVEVSWIAPSKLRRTVIVGSRKMVVYDDVSSEQVKVFDKGFDYTKPEGFGEWQLATRTGDIVIPKLDSNEPLGIELSEFIAAVRRREAPSDSLRLSRDVVKLIEAADRSLRLQAERVSRQAPRRTADLVAR